MAARGRLRVDRDAAIVVAAMLTVGGGFAAFGGWQLWTTWAYLGDAVTVSAEVLAANESCDDDGCTWWPEVAFETPGGEARTARTQFGSSEYGFSEGSRIDVLYNPAYDYVRVPGTGNLWLLGAAFFALGLFAVLPALWVLANLTVYREGGKG